METLHSFLSKTKAFKEKRSYRLLLAKIISYSKVNMANHDFEDLTDDVIDKAKYVKVLMLCDLCKIEYDDDDEITEKHLKIKLKEFLSLEKANRHAQAAVLEKLSRPHMILYHSDTSIESCFRLVYKRIQVEMQNAADIPDNEVIQTLSMTKLFRMCKSFNIEVSSNDTKSILRDKLLDKRKSLQEKGEWLEKTTKRFEQDSEAVKEIYKKLQTFLEIDDCRPWIKPEIDRRHGGNVFDEIKKKIEEINKKECSIVVTGETSAGKSSFLNMLFGFDILPQSVLHCTNTICRIKNSSDKRLEVTDFDGNTTIQGRDVSDEEFRKTIKTYTTVDEEEQKQNVKYVDIYWPVPLLQANITIVDTPGVSDNSELTKRLFDFLPQALAFIYILNTPNDGGVQTDRKLPTIRKY
ncbi:hypothetical protein KUTeg_000532 [Tegillarca granosa]|uniref:Dynamin N-terminal domain-containing protein n=1 Tax=Tegillarca granosa TaxID=220873 RepID=A0ABQ9G0Y3_TEGGR|nr:hypothetical protein KUTeg_000532 [Tegillarca granosa]